MAGERDHIRGRDGALFSVRWPADHHARGDSDYQPGQPGDIDGGGLGASSFAGLLSPDAIGHIERPGDDRHGDRHKDDVEPDTIVGDPDMIGRWCRWAFGARRVVVIRRSSWPDRFLKLAAFCIGWALLSHYGAGHVIHSLVSYLAPWLQYGARGILHWGA